MIVLHYTQFMYLSEMETKEEREELDGIWQQMYAEVLGWS